MRLFKDKITAVTHNGSFHADDVFACAALSVWAEKEGKILKIIRTRDEKEIEKADLVLDVGGVYDPQKNRFDHHQRGGAGERGNGIPYASFGLVWKEFGPIIAGGNEEADLLDEKVVAPIDAMDNGINISRPDKSGVVEYAVADMMCNFNPTWQEDMNKISEQFDKAFHIAKEILVREIAWANAMIEGEKQTMEMIKSQNEPEILILDNNVEWQGAVSKNKNIKFVIHYKKTDSDSEWHVNSARDDLNDYNSDRALFPESWRGLRDGELKEISGIEDAVFCHRAGFFAVTKSKEGAIEMAKQSLKNIR